MRSRLQALFGAGEIGAVQIDVDTHQNPVALGGDSEAPHVERQIGDLQRFGRAAVAARRTSGGCRGDPPHLGRAASIREEINEAPIGAPLRRIGIGGQIRHAPRIAGAPAGIHEPDGGAALVRFHVRGAHRIGHAFAVGRGRDVGDALETHQVLNAERLRVIRARRGRGRGSGGSAARRAHQGKPHEGGGNSVGSHCEVSPQDPVILSACRT